MTKKLLSLNLLPEKNTNSITQSIGIAFSILLVLSISVGLLFLEYSTHYYQNKTAPNQFFQDNYISGIQSQQIESYLQNLLTSHLKTNVTFEFADLQKTFTLKQLGTNENFLANLKQIKVYTGKPARLEVLKDNFISRRHKAILDLDTYDLQNFLEANFAELAPPKSAQFAWNELALIIHPETIGNQTNFNEIRKQILQHQSQILIPVRPRASAVTTSDLEPFLDAYQRFIANPIKLTHKQSNFDYTPQDLAFEKANNQLVAKLNQQDFDNFYEQNLKPNLEIQPETLTINYLNDKVIFDGLGKFGRTIKQSELITDIENHITTQLFSPNQVSTTQSVTILTKDTPPKLEVDPILRNRGIQELFSYGFTTYYNSPPNRLHNIVVGTERYSGLIIKQGETFSFNELLGPVDATAGYKQELVIKSEGTIPEYGGGICQVSTTLYRAALFGGLNITERHSHSYAVSYYAQVLGHGLDATIYPGIKDFRFLNDTKGDILIHAFTEGPTMTVRFYGTRDNRKVDLQGPIIHSQTPPPAPIYITNNSLPPNTLTQLEKPVAGLSTKWTRTLTFPDGTVKSEDINSFFRSVPAKYAISPDRTF